jgi:O-antigen/teichoic acid export membrane protein
VTAEPPPDAARASYREGAAFAGASFAVLGVLGVFTGIIQARIYGIETMGEYALAVVPALTVTFLSQLGKQAALVRELAVLPARAPRVTALLYVVLAFSFAITLLVATITMVVVFFLFEGPVDQPDLFMPALVNMLGFLFVTNTAFTLDIVFAAFRAGRELFWIRLNEAVVFFAVGAGLGLAWDSVWGLVIATVAAYATSLVQRLLVVRRFMRARVSREELREGWKTLPEVIRFGLKTTPGSIADGAGNNAATWVLGIVAPVTVVGAYNRAWLLGKRFVELNQKVTEMLFPTLVERKEAGDHRGFDRALIDSARYTAVGMLLPAAAAGGASGSVMQLFGDGFIEGADALAVLLLVPTLACIAGVMRYALYAYDRPLAGSGVIIARMVVTIAATVPLAIWLDATGAALAVFAGYLVDMVWMIGLARRHLTQPILRLWPARQIVALLVAYAAGFAVAQLVDTWLDGIAGLVPALLAGSVVYAAVFLALGGVDARDRQRFGEIRERLKSAWRTRRAPAVSG